MRADKIQSSRPFFQGKSMTKILGDIEQSLNEGVLTDSNHVKEFESKFAEYIKVKDSIAVNSGTSALEIALRYFNVKEKEVIVPTNTFVATPNSVIFAGGKPIFADMREDTLCIDPEDIQKKISPRTAGIIVVHIAGLVCPQINEIKELCEDRGMFLLEDSAHAHGASIDGKKAGSLGDAGCFSFYPTKVMTTCEGGMITTNDPKLTQAANCMRSHGQDSQRLMVMLGYNWRMNEIAAIIGKYQLENLERFINIRNKIAKIYEKELSRIDGVTILGPPNGVRHSYYKYPIRLEGDLDREKIAEVLQRNYNIETGNIYYPPCHLHPFYQNNYQTKEGDLPVAENVLKKVICLPMHVGINKKDVLYISKSLEETINLLQNNT